MTDIDLDAIRAREQTASPGPWVRGNYITHEPATRDDDAVIVGPDMVIYDEGGHSGADAEFIAHARADIPALIAAVQRRDDALAAVLALCDEWEAAYRRIFQTPAQLAAFGGSMPVVQVDADEVRDAITAHLTPADSPTTEEDR